ncbi:hypothetical protein ACFQMA_13965 [Halosimplex aquaticum]|uniref:Uncharacterized protein n=1 Tax=Halosimplex aquaticum TaxID=3026162 RepID=A0ABD5Y1Z0_9EURY|nr:hypothetical protein [Halosimplex aquaticum]
MPTYDTTTADESIHDRQPLDGATTTLASLTVPAGELWYVDGVYVTADGSGDASGVEVSVGVGDGATLDGIAPSIDRAGRGSSVGVDTTRPDGGAATVDAYASAGEEIRVVESYEQGSTGGYHYSVQVRRVV